MPLVLSLTLALLVSGNTSSDQFDRSATLSPIVMQLGEGLMPLDDGAEMRSRGVPFIPPTRSPFIPPTRS